MGYNKNPFTGELIMTEYTKDVFTAIVEREDEPINPRDDDTFGTIVADRIQSDTPFTFSGNRDEDIKTLQEDHGAVVILPIYMYSHSGDTISTTPFGCRFDSGQVGWIFATEADVFAEFDVSENGIAEAIKQAEDMLREEIAAYDAYLTGSIYQYIIKKGMVEVVDGCGGYLSEEVAMKDAIHMIDCYIEREMKEEFPLFVAADVEVPEYNKGE